MLAIAYAWYRTGFRTPRALRLAESKTRRMVVAFGLVLVVAIIVKPIGGFLGDGRISIGERHVYRTREPMLFMEEIAGELVMVGGIGALLIVLGRRHRRTPASDA
jgi:hypothetical protein